MSKEKNKATVETIYTEVFNNGRADLFPNLVAGPYIQHNPLFPNGTAPLMEYIKQAGSIPCEVKRMQLKVTWFLSMCGI